MRRRAFLGAGLAGLASLAGCLDAGTDATAPGDRDAGGTTPAAGTGTADAGNGGGAFDSLPIPRNELDRGAPKDGIPAITDTAFAEDWSGLELEVPSSFGDSVTIEPRLNAEDPVIGVEREGDARAYPLGVLNWHEVCNDGFHGPLLVTYCPLCRTGLAATRRVDGEATVFGVSGLLYESNLVMYDRLTESLWSQVAATAIRGEKTGTRLDLQPSTITGWGNWRETHPDTTVLLPPPESNTVAGPDATRNYTRNPYAGYENTRQVGLGRQEYDDRLHPKTLVVGVASGGVARAYPLGAVEEAGVVNDAVGGLPVVVTTDASGNLVAYVRRVDGETLEFAPRDGATLRAGGSAWRRTDGRAVEGPHEGTALERANDMPPLFWFSWADLHPDTDIFGR